MLSRAGLGVLVFAIAVLVAACAGGPGGTPSPTGASPPAAGGLTTFAAETQAPSTGEPGDDDPGDGDAPHQVPDLEQMLPAEVGGVPLNRASVRGDEAIEELSLSDDMIAAIGAAGRSVSDAEFAVAAPEDSAFVVVAVRVPGLDAVALRTALLANNDPETLPVREGQIAGKSVVSVGESQFYYATGDVLFFVLGDANVANFVIPELP